MRIENSFHFILFCALWMKSYTEWRYNLLWNESFFVRYLQAVGLFDWVPRLERNLSYEAATRIWEDCWWRLEKPKGADTLKLDRHFSCLNKLHSSSGSILTQVQIYFTHSWQVRPFYSAFADPKWRRFGIGVREALLLVHMILLYKQIYYATSSPGTPRKGMEEAAALEKLSDYFSVYSTLCNIKMTR